MMKARSFIRKDVLLDDFKEKEESLDQNEAETEENPTRDRIEPSCKRKLDPIATTFMDAVDGKKLSFMCKNLKKVFKNDTLVAT